MNALREALLRGRRRPRNSGAGSPAQYRGDGYEFVELREYVAGDDVRRIDWAATARTGALQTRVILEDVALTLAAILDDSASMRVGRGRALAESAQEALQTWFAAASADDRCIRICGDDVVAPRNLRGVRGAQACIWARSSAPFTLPRSIEVATAALSNGTALLVISDWHDLRHEHDAVLALAARRFDCTALIARDPWYGGLPLRGFVRLRDAQSGEQHRLYIGRTQRERYARAVREREAQLVRRFESAGWRVGIFDESDGGAALMHAFALQ